MPINGSEIVGDPASKIFKPFTDLLGNGFFLIPISFITVALYMKTRDIVMTSAFMIGSGLLFASGNLFSEYPEMSYVYIIFSVLGLVGLIVGLFFVKK